MAEIKSNAEELLDQHLQIMKAVQDVREFLKEPRPEIGAESSHVWGASMAAKLANLHDQLHRHFRAEESSELLD